MDAEDRAERLARIKELQPLYAGRKPTEEDARFLREMFGMLRLPRAGETEPRTAQHDPEVRVTRGRCPFDARGHNDAQIQGPRGGLYWVCNLCGRKRRARRWGAKQPARPARR